MNLYAADNIEWYIASNLKILALNELKYFIYKVHVCQSNSDINDKFSENTESIVYVKLEIFVWTLLEQKLWNAILGKAEFFT